MDKRITFPGGERNITNTELNLMPISNQLALFGMMLGISEANDVIVSGVNAVINAGIDVQVQDGFIFLNGELLKVDAVIVAYNGAIAGNLYQFEKVVTNNVAEYDRPYRDGSTHNVAEFSRGVPVQVAAITGLSVDGDTISDQLKTSIRVQANYTEADANDPSFIKNKPTILELLHNQTITSWSYNSTVTVLHNAGKLPNFAKVIGVCKVANNGYLVGDRVQLMDGTFDFEHGGGANQWAFQFDLTGTTTARLIISSEEVKIVDKLTRLRALLLSTQWNLEISIY